jgi:hypothetical protein
MTDPTERRAKEIERLAISFHAFSVALAEARDKPSLVTVTALRVWARALKTDQIVAGVDMIDRRNLDSLLGPGIEATILGGSHYADPFKHIQVAE